VQNSRLFFIRNIILAENIWLRNSPLSNAEKRFDILFQTLCKKGKIKDEKHLRELICYVHKNAQKHKLVEDFRD